MPRTTFYFTSQKLGPATVVIEVDDNGHGHIQIIRGAAHSMPITFAFDEAQVASKFTAEQPSLTAARLAIAQAQRMSQIARSDSNRFPVLLDVDARPWIGDLTDSHTSRSTDGYDNRMTRAARPRARFIRRAAA